ncbi:MAG: hypothetical protein HYV27_25315 [Candidatus Hydrogenedentes bacterium]|nr:hypothetical protein [Candidatus Hydrogenedentota bacterium]
MPRLLSISKRPAVAQDVAPDVKLTILRDILELQGSNGEAVSLLDIIIPLFVNKNPSNPAA